MFDWLKHKKDIQLPVGMVDLHNHVLPGVDDGPKTIDSSLEMLRDFAASGYSTVSVSCHMMHHRFPNVSSELIRNTVEQVQTRLKEEGIAIQLLPGCEIFFDDRFLIEWEAGTLLPVGGDGPYYLIEFSLRDPMLRMKELVFELSVKGIRPILAHPERYDVLLRKPELIHAWKEAGWIMQLDLCSLLPDGVRDVRKLAQRYIHEHVFDIAATDLHGPTGRVREMATALARETNEDELKRLLVTNPQRILEGHYVIQIDQD